MWCSLDRSINRPWTDAFSVRTSAVSCWQSRPCWPPWRLPWWPGAGPRSRRLRRRASWLGSCVVCVLVVAWMDCCHLCVCVCVCVISGWVNARAHASICIRAARPKQQEAILRFQATCKVKAVRGYSRQRQGYLLQVMSFRVPRKGS